ncbi:dUTPase family protein [Babesia bovis T2Bo]|uniref:Deoxyuridine 5'-triphosphate nucleotidohydrolase n=1 Tax=Babesia bovis TaxID=5865 RepID=A7AQW9_BABBO|nr:dUTPase family protein [Babesia bovis T2Bo]EDO06938.1 dUTPase family protein [Babesia bovis T2Bo]|eukprot:XP_001610506.1 deoxyuridine 5'-triphosphate nucleotidohydrolase [Babesia bovis T2Bo]
MMHIKILPRSPEVAERYKTHKSYYPGDCGLDLFCPDTITLAPKKTTDVVLGVKIAAYRVHDKSEIGSSSMRNVGWILAPRSSISKTPLRLANSIGIIDAAYRGDIKVAFDNISDEPYTIQSGDRLVQVISYDGEEISYELVNELDQTERGEKGFGSTGR